MKYLTLSLLLLSATGGLLCAKPLCFNNAAFTKQLEEMVNQAQPKQIPWQQQLRSMQEQFAQTGNTSLSYPTPQEIKTKSNSNTNPRYMQRLLELQEKINTNPYLKGYRFAAPKPDDLAQLSRDNYAALYAFLQNLPTAQVTRTQWEHPFTLSLHIQGVKAGELELWVDEPTQSIYLMSDNFFTTAASKYAPHRAQK